MNSELRPLQDANAAQGGGAPALRHAPRLDRGRDAVRSLSRDLLDSFRNPEFWALSSWLDIVVRSRESRLGLFWLLMPSIVYVWGVGSFFAAMQHKPMASFVAYVGVGYVIFRAISSVITESANAFFSGTAFILDGHLRLTDFVLRVVAKALFHFAMSVPAIAVALMIQSGVHWDGLGWSLLSFPLVMLNALWIGVVFAIVGARFPDMSQFVSNIFMFTFLLTPIVWHADSLPVASTRYTLMRINPLYHMIEIVRAPILGEPIDTATYRYLAVMTLAGFACAAFLYRRYARFVPIWI